MLWWRHIVFFRGDTYVANKDEVACERYDRCVDQPPKRPKGCSVGG